MRLKLPPLAFHFPKPPWHYERWLAVPGVLLLIVGATGQAFTFSGMQLGYITSPWTRIFTVALGVALFAISFFVTSTSVTKSPGAAVNGNAVSAVRVVPPATMSQDRVAPTQPHTQLPESVGSLNAAAVRKDVSPPAGVRENPRPEIGAGQTLVSSGTMRAPHAVALTNGSRKVVPVEWEPLARLRTLEAQLDAAISNYFDLWHLPMDCERLRTRLELALRDSQRLDEMDWSLVRERLEELRRQTANPDLTELSEFRTSLAVAMDVLARLISPKDPKKPIDIEAIVRKSLNPAVDRMLTAGEAFEAASKKRSKDAVDGIRDAVQDIFRTVPADSGSTRQINEQMTQSTRGPSSRDLERKRGIQETGSFAAGDQIGVGLEADI